VDLIGQHRAVDFGVGLFAGSLLDLEFAFVER
jgi:hypothetical protein